MATVAELNNLGLTTGALLRAAASLGVQPPSNRRDHVLQSLASSGRSEGEIVTAARASAAPVTPAQAGVDVDAAVDAAVAGAESRLGARIDAAAAAFKALRGDHEAAYKALRQDVSALADPGDLIRDAVREAVAGAFEPLRTRLDAAPAPIRQTVIDAAPRERRSVQSVFGATCALLDCEVWGPQGDIDPDYVWREEHLNLALLALETGDNVWLYGERGTGKTQFAMQLAARLGRPFVRVSFDAEMSRDQFVGGVGLSQGSTEWQDGALLAAFRVPGTIILLDEITAIRPEFATVLHTLLEPGAVYTIPGTGETVQRAPGVCFIAADNTNGCGDETGRYAGTRTQNAALVDRFAFSQRVEFLPPAEEIALLVKRGAKKADATKLVKVLTACRAEVGGLLLEPPSLRGAFAFIKALTVLSADRAWEVSVVNKAPSVSAEALRQLFVAHWEA